MQMNNKIVYAGIITGIIMLGAVITQTPQTVSYDALLERTYEIPFDLPFCCRLIYEEPSFTWINDTWFSFEAKFQFQHVNGSWNDLTEVVITFNFEDPTQFSMDRKY